MGQSSTLTILFLASGLMASAQVRMVVKQTDLQQYGLTLAGPETADFQSYLKQKMSDEDIRILQPILPLSVLVQNAGARKIAVVGVRFEILDELGRMTQHLDYTNDLDPWHSSNHLGPGGSRLVTILRPFAEAIARKQVSSLPVQPFYTANLRTLSSLMQMKAITVALDAIVFENGEFVGPDLGEEFARLVQKRKAEQDFYAEMERLVPLGITEVKEGLKVFSSAKETPRKDFLHWDVYTRRLVALANSTLALVNLEGVDYVNRRIQEYKAHANVVQLRKLQQNLK